jgi:hypothetical protein
MLRKPRHLAKMRMAGFLFLRLGFVVLMKRRIRRHPFRPISGTLNGSPGCFGAAGKPDRQRLRQGPSGVGCVIFFAIGNLENLEPLEI